MDIPQVSSEIVVGSKPDEKVASSNSPGNAATLVAIEPPTPLAEMIPTLEEAVDFLSETVKKENVALDFRIDEILNRPVVTVISEETGEIVRQLPQEEVLRAVRNIESMKGILFQDDA